MNLAGCRTDVRRLILRTGWFDRFPVTVRFMDSGVLWTVIGSVTGLIAVGLTAWQVRLQIVEHRQAGVPRHQEWLPDSGGLPVAVPLGRLPVEVRGRDALLGELCQSFGRRLLAARLRWSGPRVWVLAGMGGLGKSTVALAAARAARARGWKVWWVTATDAASLTGGMLEVLRQLRAPELVIRPVCEGVPAAPDHVWEFLNGPHLAGRRWLLIFDNADNPAVLAGHDGST